MSAWVTIPCLLALRAEFNHVNPERDKGADGTIGDTAHTSSSDHTPDEDSDVLRDHDADSKNEVHALDIDSTGPWPESGWFNRTVLALVAREKAEYESPDVFGRLQYVIWNNRIASRSWGWTWRDYGGSDPHINHAHFSGRYTTAQEQDTRPWGVYEEDDMVTAAEISAIAEAVWNFQVLNPYNNALQPAQTPLRYAPSKTPHEQTWARLDVITALVNALVASEAADDAAKAQALTAIQNAITAMGPSIAAVVVAALPEGAEITQEMVTTAVMEAFAAAFGNTPQG